MADTINTEMIPDAIEVMHDMGFLGTSQEAKEFLAYWKKLDIIEKSTVIGMMKGATAAYITTKGA